MMFSQRTPLRASFALALLFACGGAFAQTAVETQMTPEEFKAAGLDKLSPQELANLNAWLNRTVQTESAKAATEAKKKIEDEDRGFFHFNSDEPVVGHLVGEFRSFAKGRRYTLDNGQEWVQIDDAELSGVRLTNPEVRIKPAMVGNSWYMSVGKYHTQAQVKRVK